MTSYNDDAFDHNGLLKDGHSVSYKMFTMDAQRRDAKKFVRRGRQGEYEGETTEEEDALSARDAALRRPGWRPRAHPASVLQQASERAYAAYDSELTQAWRNDAGEFSAKPKEGDVCTVKAGAGKYGTEGAPGRLKRIGNKLVCVAIPSREEEEAARDSRDDRIYGRPPGRPNGEPDDDEEEETEVEEEETEVEEEDDDEEDQIEAAYQGYQTHTESGAPTERRRRRDSLSFDALVGRRNAVMTKIYATLDAELSEAWRA